MTAYQSPFQFGTLATEENFIDRVEDRAMLKQMLASHINVMLISPRRWGKSSLVKKAMGELSAEDKNVRICYIDAFSIGSEAEFYRTFASQVIACASSKMERWIEDAKKFLTGVVPQIVVNRRFWQGRRASRSSCASMSFSNWQISLSIRTWRARCVPFGNSSS